MRRTTRQMAQWLRILCAVALLSVGFAHNPVMAFAATANQAAAYQLPDGSFAELCTVNDLDQHKGKMSDHGCEACRLTTSTLIPTAPIVAGDILRISTDARVFERPESVRHRLYPPNSGPRAPPFTLLNV